MLKKTEIKWLQICIFFIFIFVNPIFADSKVTFKVRIDQSIASGNESFSGRLLIFMTSNLSPVEALRPDFLDINSVYITGVEVSNLNVNKPIMVNPDLISFPAPFSKVSTGEYQIMALLDQNYSYTYNGMGAGDICSNVIKKEIAASEIELTLSKIIPEKEISIPGNVQIVEFESPALSKFWGKAVKIQASVIFPPNYAKSKSKKYPTVYDIHGYGGNHLSALRNAPNIVNQMRKSKRPEMIYVYLNANCSLGHHVFADSVNTGPWGHALTTEFIPYLEEQFQMERKASSRFLTGHSSGGWATLWVMVNYPDFFGGTWSTAPDPVDFQNFTGPNLAKYPPQNLYRNEKGKSYNLVRYNGKEIMSLEQYVKQERVLGYFGGQFGSFDAVFSPKGLDGQPMPLFCRETGVIDPFVQKAWEKYDISRILRDNWETLGPKLKGKIHIIVGTKDTFHLDESVRLLDAELKKLKSDIVIEYVEGRDHFNLYHGGLGERIAYEMYNLAQKEK